MKLLVQVSKRLNRCGVDYFGVASIDEGVILRKQGIKKPILIEDLTRKVRAVLDQDASAFENASDS